MRDRIDRGFGDERVYALQTEEAYAVHAARTAAPALQGSPGIGSAGQVNGLPARRYCYACRCSI